RATPRSTYETRPEATAAALPTAATMPPPSSRGSFGRGGADYADDYRGGGTSTSYAAPMPDRDYAPAPPAPPARPPAYVPPSIPYAGAFGQPYAYQAVPMPGTAPSSAYRQVYGSDE